MSNKHSEKYIRIGLNIALQRKLKKMTQNQLAEKIGISVLDISPEVLFKIN